MLTGKFPSFMFLIPISIYHWNTSSPSSSRRSSQNYLTWLDREEQAAASCNMKVVNERERRNLLVLFSLDTSAADPIGFYSHLFGHRDNMRASNNVSL